MSTNVLDFAVKTIDGKDKSLNDFKGQVLLIVNVASKCGLTPQYEALEDLYKNFKDQGFTILGFPANDFGSQEPGSNKEIQEFCSLTYGVDFPMFEKIEVTGPNRHPLYKALIEARPEAETDGASFEEKLKGYGFSRKEPQGILWNFEKFLINKKGEVVKRFAPDVKPDSQKVISAIESELK